MDVLRPPNNVTEFVLLGLTQNPHLQKILFIVFLFIFLFTVLSNLLIVITVSLSPTLSAPMYFFLTYLAFIDASFTSVTTPNITIDLLYQRTTVSWAGCLTQLFLVYFLGGTKDRPHCHGVWPLRGHLQASALHDHHATGALPALGGCVLDWGGRVVHATMQILFTVNLTFCGPNVMDHFMCDFFSLLEIECGNTYKIGIIVAAKSGAKCLLIFSMVLISYLVILSSLKSHGSEGWCKASSFYMWCSLYCSGTLLCPLYIQLHTTCDYLLCGQVGNCVLCNPHSHVESYNLHSEKYRSEKCHE